MDARGKARRTSKRAERPAAAPRALLRRRDAASERIVARLRKLCLALPAANEKLSHGEPTWFAGTGKVFAMLDDHHHAASHLSVWLPAAPDVQEALVAGDPSRFFRPPYVGHRGWVGVVLDPKPDWAAVGALAEEAYRLVAPRRLVAELDRRRR